MLRPATTIALLAALLAPLPAFAAEPALDDCDAAVRDRPDDRASWVCYQQVAQRNRSWRQVAERVRVQVDLAPDRGWPRLMLGRILGDIGDPESIEWVRSAADRFREREQPGLEVEALVTLSRFLRSAGRREEVEPELQRALAIAEEAGVPMLVARVEADLGWQRFYQHRFAEALRYLESAKVVAVPDGSHDIQVNVLEGFASVNWGLGRFRDAMDGYQEILDRFGGEKPFRDAGVLRNKALAASRLFGQRGIEFEELQEIRREALEAAVRTGNRSAEAGLRLMLAGGDWTEEGLRQARLGVEAARASGHFRDLCWGLLLLAEKTHVLGPERAEEALSYLDEAVRLATDRLDPTTLANTLATRAHMLRNSGQDEGFDAAMTEALDAIDRIRELQADREVRARVFGRYVNTYNELAARILQRWRDEPYWQERAFHVMERRRSRVLLDSLDAVRASSSLAEADRVVFATLEGVRSALTGRQAMLVYQLDNEVVGDLVAAYGGSWLLCVTTGGVEVLHLADLAVLEDQIRMYMAMMKRRDGSHAPAAARLYDELLADALAGLPAEVDELILVPDAVLHHLPFEALLKDADGGYLAEDYSVSVVPSATAWLRWTRAGESPDREPLLTVADPSLPYDVENGTYRGPATSGTDLELGPLPHARDEARSILDALGGGLMLLGPNATERAFRDAPPDRFDILHVAAHAVVDDRRPDRSAIVLSHDALPEEPSEDDGLLQYREIVDLDLDGQVVVLSACRSGSGPVIQGDGVMGLANAFFLAGARTVVAGLWPLRDDDATRMVTRFGEHLGEGRCVSDALTAAKREAIADGEPVAAWAGFVVLGDGGVMPCAGRHHGTKSWPAWVAVAAALTLAAAILVRRRIRRAG